MKKTIFYFIYGVLAIPLLLLILFPITFKSLEMLFWVLFLVSLVPCAIIDIVLSIIALIKSFKEKNKLFIILSIIPLIISALTCVGGVLGLMLLYVVLA